MTYRSALVQFLRWLNHRAKPTTDLDKSIHEDVLAALSSLTSNDGDDDDDDDEPGNDNDGDDGTRGGGGDDHGDSRSDAEQPSSSSSQEKLQRLAGRAAHNRKETKRRRRQQQQQQQQRKASLYGEALQPGEVERVCELYWDLVDAIDGVSTTFSWIMPLQIGMLICSLMVNMWQMNDAAESGHDGQVPNTDEFMVLSVVITT